MPTIKIELENDVGVERTLTLPAKYEVCDQCEGEGTILNPNIGQHAYSQEEFDEAFEPGSEEREHYFKRGGMYDVTCPSCKGKRVVAVLDESAFRKPAHLKLLKRINDSQRARAQADAEILAEGRMERMMCGDYD